MGGFPKSNKRSFSSVPQTTGCVHFLMHMSGSTTATHSPADA